MGGGLLMAHFLYRELAINHPSNRGEYLESKEVIHYSFAEGNRYKEAWRGMYIFKTQQPKEGDASFGDFYMEIDEESFPKLRSMVLNITDYLKEVYQLSGCHLNFFSTNRSIWISIPSKVFACYGRTRLHLIHKAMAEEINAVLMFNTHSLQKDKGQHYYQDKLPFKGLDMSIYRWNGLMRTLGSYLPKSGRWVTKFNLSDLEDAVSMECLSKSKFDSGISYSDVQPVPAAVEWFARSEKKAFETKEKKPTKIFNQHQGMENFIERGELPFHRNLHVYSMALYLKDKGLGLEETIECLTEKFQDSYIRSNEALRTVRSAFKGNKHFAPMTARSYLDERIFEEYTTEKKSFLVPRSFISTLHKQKAHYRSYKLLFKVLYLHQIHKIPYILDLRGTKYKKQELAYFEKLKQAGFISYAVEADIVTASLVYQVKEVFQSHIVLPNQFMESRVFKELKREFVVLAELWRGSFKTSEEKFTYFFTTKAETVRRNIGMQQKTLNRHMTLLKRLKLVVNGFVLPVATKRERKGVLCRKVPLKAVWNVHTSIAGGRFAKKVNLVPKLSFFNLFSLIIKCNYRKDLSVP